MTETEIKKAELPKAVQAALTKEFVGYKAYGKTHEYFPLVSKDVYKKFITKGLLKDYFSGSLKNLVSHFAEKEKIDVKELDEILKIIEQTKKKK